ncbi:uncharacterized protein At4g15970-like [Rutidosis leptorrhynchoides]|uniref:uncharacterized protein At4g15970-like n=1 Tax=Rutidosis leptorrhynchoides TaxID=125765 RepID=UPI003A9A0C9B
MAANVISFRPTMIRACASSDHRKSESKNAGSVNWLSPIFGWSNEPDYIGDEDAKRGAGPEIDLKLKRNRFSPGCFTAEKAKQLRLMTHGSASFHDVMYHSAIASRLATDFNGRQADGVSVSVWTLYDSPYPLQLLPGSTMGDYDHELERVLKNTSMADKTVIITTLNEAWAEPGSLLDLFLESFKIGKGTMKLLNHLVIVSLDRKAHDRCLNVHHNCYKLDVGNNVSGEAYFMTPSYLEMMWKRIEFLTVVLKLGYNFVATDTDIMWLQDPFPRFFPNADFQIACDHYHGNPHDRNNDPNGGFTFVKSNKHTISFYNYWYASRSSYPGQHDQDVLNRIKRSLFIAEIGLKMVFLDTANFAGFCERSNDFRNVCTMHANCCLGLHNKIVDLKLVLEDWRKFSVLPPGDDEVQASLSWRAPRNCTKLGMHTSHS